MPVEPALDDSRTPSGQGDGGRADEVRAATLLGDVGQLPEEQLEVGAVVVARPDQRADRCPACR